MTTHEALLDTWNANLDCAEAMLPQVGQLYRKHGVVTKVFGRLLVNQSPVDLIKAHKFPTPGNGQRPMLAEQEIGVEAWGRLEVMLQVRERGAGPGPPVIADEFPKLSGLKVLGRSFGGSRPGRRRREHTPRLPTKAGGW